MQTINTLQDLKKEIPNLDQSRLGYLDIETTGLDFNKHKITLVGLHSADSTSVYIDLHNHQRAKNDIANYNYLVTFNGNRFDLPFIEKHQGFANNSFTSVDLYPLLKELGYSGGLKRIEHNLGLERMDLVDGMYGKEAVGLWEQYKAGNQQALKKLVNYNIEDIVSLEVLYNFVLQNSLGNKISSDILKNWKNEIMERIKAKDCLYIFT